MKIMMIHKDVFEENIHTYPRAWIVEFTTGKSGQRGKLILSPQMQSHSKSN